MCIRDSTNTIMKKIILLIGILLGLNSHGQVSIGAALPNTSANLDVTADDINGNKRGLLIPRLALLNTTDASTINTCLLYTSRCV